MTILSRLGTVRKDPVDVNVEKNLHLQTVMNAVSDTMVILIANPVNVTSMVPSILNVPLYQVLVIVVRSLAGITVKNARQDIMISPTVPVSIVNLI